MSATAEEVLATLKSIDARLATLNAHFGAGIPGPPTRASSTMPTIATEFDMDGKYGNPRVRCDPRDWTGEPCKGLTLSECPPEHLELYADLLANFFAVKNDENNEKDSKGRPKSYWDRKDAALARGWAARKRAGWTPPDETTGFPSDASAPITDDDIPFAWLLPFMLPALLAVHSVLG